MAESRWATEFAQHPFQNSWKLLKAELVDVAVDDQTVVTSVYELARLKRVVAYLDQIISALDPDLTPKGIWPSFQQQTDACLAQLREFVSNKNISHIAAANEHADNLLTYVRPYQVVPQDALKALKRSAEAYSSQFETYLEAFREKSLAIVEQLLRDKEASASSLITTEASKAKVEALSSELFVGNADTPAIDQKIRDLLGKADENSNLINNLHSELLIGTPQVESIQAKVKSAQTDILNVQGKMMALLDGGQVEIRQLEGFHEKIFGKWDPSTAKPVGGLESELQLRTSELTVLEREQKIKHAALVREIETLLPGATSAGLATAYKSLKDNFSKPIAQYTRFFYGSLGALVVAAFVMAVEEVTLLPTLSITFVEIPDWDVILKALLYKTPFIVPVVWLALFSSTRRSQYERLQQEYAHKEALAASYESYKKQLQDLKGDSEALQRELISKAIDALAYNASVTLDGKHEEKLPSQQLLKKVSLDELKKIIEIVKGTKLT